MPTLDIPVKITIATNKESGEELLLRTDKEFDEYQRVAESDLEEDLRMREIQGAIPQFLETRRAFEKARIQASFERQRRDRDAALPHSITYDFTLKKPDYGQYIRYESAATTADQFTGEVRFDQNAFADMALTESVFDASGEKALDVSTGFPIIVGRELRGRLCRAIFPDAKRLPFTVLASAPTSKTA